MAPEVIRHEEYGGKADVYSFGVLLCELGTKQHFEFTVSGGSAARM